MIIIIKRKENRGKKDRIKYIWLKKIIFIIIVKLAFQKAKQKKIINL